jgi:hypothetical protein
MVYKHKLAVLSGITAALAVVYVLTFVFDPQLAGSRSDAYTWLEPGQKDRISGITITGSGETVSLERKEGRWFVSHNGRDYPARQARIEDFIEALAKRAPYPLRSSSASLHERLSLGDDSAIRVTVTGGSGPPLLSLLIGHGDVTGQNVYLRRQGQNEVRSGEDIFSTYTGSSITAWYNLRLFPEAESGRLDAAAVQRLTVYPPPNDEGENTQPQIFTRRGREWAFNFEHADPDMQKVDTYIRDILNTSGNDFIDTVIPADPMFNYSRIVLELGDGSVRTVRIGPQEEDSRRYATVTGTDLVYALPEWTASRLFPGTEFFEK